ncbi:MAG: preprotein translocase subunit SecG [Eubacteriales bacterium]|nr:preprotein translocase subunit SecG [Eubacteriales bacterium]
MVVTVLSVIQVIACLFLIVTILLQKAPSRGMSGALSGQQETFFGSNKATGIEAVLANLTKIFGVVFVIVSLILVLLG